MPILRVKQLNCAETYIGPAGSNLHIYMYKCVVQYPLINRVCLIDTF